MADPSSNARARLLDPIERSSEVLFGLIMVLTFTGSFRAMGADHDDVKRLLIAALGSNLAWGIIDAVMYLMATLSQRGHNLVLLRAVQAAPPEAGRRLLSEAMSDDLAEVLRPACCFWGVFAGFPLNTSCCTSIRVYASSRTLVAGVELDRRDYAVSQLAWLTANSPPVAHGVSAH